METQIPIEDATYAAGIMDGEGTIGIYNVRRTPRMKSPNYRAVVAVSMTKPMALKFLRARWGGKIRECKELRKGLATPFRWSLEGPRALAFLNDIKEFLLIKYEQAYLAIALLSSQRNNRNMHRGLSEKEVAYRDSLCKECHRLNQKGISIGSL